MSPTAPRPVEANITLPATIWLAPATTGHPTPAATPDPGSLLPDWALRRIRTEFTRRPGSDTPAPLLHLDIPDTNDGMDARAHHLPTHATPPPVRGPVVLLAQLRPDTPCAPTGEPTTAGAGAGLPAFFSRAYRLLRRGGLLLVACRQQHHHDGELHDPTGHLTAAARAAGFVYRQHILLVHATASGNRLHPTPDAPTPPPAPFWRHRPLHTDLLLFTPA